MKANPMAHMTTCPQYRWTRPVLKMMVLKENPSTAAFPFPPKGYLPSFPLDSLVMMNPEMDVATIKSANVMKTPEKPRTNTLKARNQSATGSPSLKNGKILQKPSSNYNGLKADFVRICSQWLL